MADTRPLLMTFEAMETLLGTAISGFGKGYADEKEDAAAMALGALLAEVQKMRKVHRGD